MKQNNLGFSLIETLVAMAILAAFSVSICTCMLLSLRMNGKTESLMQEQMAVSSAVEALMATGVDGSETDDTFEGVSVSSTAVDDKPYYHVTVKSKGGNVTVTTQIRAANAGGAQDEA